MLKQLGWFGCDVNHCGNLALFQLFERKSVRELHRFGIDAQAAKDLRSGHETFAIPWTEIYLFLCQILDRMDIGGRQHMNLLIV